MTTVTFISTQTRMVTSGPPTAASTGPPTAASTGSSRTNNSNIGAIVGGAVGGWFFFCFQFLFDFLYNFYPSNKFLLTLSLSRCRRINYLLSPCRFLLA